MELKYSNISIGTYSVKAAFTKEMVDELSKQYGFDYSMEELLKRQEIYKRRKQIVDKFLKEM